jgi:hypothetical protein
MSNRWDSDQIATAGRCATEGGSGNGIFGGGRGSGILGGGGGSGIFGGGAGGVRLMTGIERRGIGVAPC